MKEFIQEFINPITIPYYVLGFVVWVIFSAKEFKIRPFRKHKGYWFQSFAYTLITISLCITISFLISEDRNVTWIAAILGGFLGQFFLLKLEERRTELIHKAIDGIECKIHNVITSKGRASSRDIQRIVNETDVTIGDNTNSHLKFQDGISDIITQDTECEDMMDDDYEYNPFLENENY